MVLLGGKCVFLGFLGSNGVWGLRGLGFRVFSGFRV